MKFVLFYSRLHTKNEMRNQIMASYTFYIPINTSIKIHYFKIEVIIGFISHSIIFIFKFKI